MISVSVFCIFRFSPARHGAPQPPRVSRAHGDRSMFIPVQTKKLCHVPSPVRTATKTAQNSGQKISNFTTPFKGKLGEPQQNPSPSNAQQGSSFKTPYKQTLTSSFKTPIKSTSSFVTPVKASPKAVDERDSPQAKKLKDDEENDGKKLFFVSILNSCHNW